MQTVNKFGGEDRSELYRPPTGSSGDENYNPKATAAVVSVNLAIEGDSTKLPPGRSIRTRRDLLDYLSKIASDAQVDQCLMSAEILWAPEEPSEVMTSSDIYADYPDLVTL